MHKTTGEEQTNMNVVSVELSEHEAKMFVQFQKNYEAFSIMQEAGVFNITNGSAIINFDEGGTLTGVDFELARYRRGKRILAIVKTLA
jgi:hypothetical protein